MKLASLLVFVLLIPAPLLAYEVWIDLDEDGDPNTLRLYTDATTVTARLILAPSLPGEEIDEVYFGLGGSCRECDGVHHYGVDFDLLEDGWEEWDERADFTSWAAGVTLLGCPGDPGHHLTLELAPVSPPFLLEAPIFVATFQVRVAPPALGCLRVPSNLATMHGQGVDGVWTYAQIGGPAVPTRPASWGCLKGRYR